MKKYLIKYHDKNGHQYNKRVVVLAKDKLEALYWLHMNFKDVNEVVSIDEFKDEDLADDINE